MSGSICGTPARRRTQGVIAATRRINTGRLPRSQAPGWVTRGAVAVGRISPIRVSPITASASNGRTTRRIAVPGQIASANVQPRSVFYYNRTPQPTGQFGNGNTRLMFPLTIPAPITSLFGWRIHPITGTRRFHAGTDLGASLGTPVLAADAGKVAIADWLGGYGLTVVLEHENFTQQTLYGHLSEIFVQPGEWVEQGTVIGRVGSTGNSTGPHLHFETRQLTDQGWVATDPSVQLEDAVAELVESLRTAQLKQKPANKG
ncbi:MAG: M23 family metallopeptidase [Gloeocapsa sp. UFS-A4-WI-NPMV-4B04]|nr:M23 family metallopeptidase [Gloeocapsa sp. UFS-A4-WI-NPMV-4B04]